MYVHTRDLDRRPGFDGVKIKFYYYYYYYYYYYWGQLSDRRRHKTPAVLKSFACHTPVAPYSWNNSNVRLERVIRLSSDSSSFLQDCMVTIISDNIDVGKPIILTATCEMLQKGPDNDKQCTKL